DGYDPNAGLILSGNTLYGTEYDGRNSGSGTVFALSLPTVPALNMASVGGQSFLLWPAAATIVVLHPPHQLVFAELGDGFQRHAHHRRGLAQCFARRLL